MPINRIPRVKKALRTSDILDLYEAFGGPTTRASVSIWISKGFFPNARKRAEGANSPWIIPISDVVVDLKKRWPNGPISDKIMDVPSVLRPTLRHVCIAAYDLDIDSYAPEEPRGGRRTLPRQLK